MNINDQLKSINRKILIKDSAFLGMGVTAMFFNQPVLGLSILGIGSYLGLQEININLKLRQKKPIYFNQIPLAFIYRKKFNLAFDDYIEKSSTDIERKFKLLLTAYYMKQQNLDVRRMINKNYLVCEQLISHQSDNRDHVFSLNNSLSKVTHRLEDICMVMPEELFKEDFLNSQSLEIAKQVYKDFNSFGFLGKIITHEQPKKNPDTLIASLQDYRLNSSDIKIIEKRTKYLNSIPKDIKYIYPIEKEDEKILMKDILIHNPEHHNVLMKFFKAYYAKEESSMNLKFLKEIENSSDINKFNIKLNEQLKDKNHNIKKIKI